MAAQCAGIGQRGWHVGHQPGIAGRVLAQQHFPALQARQLAQRRLDLAQLDAQAAQLHLVVAAAEVLDRTIVAPARHIAGAIDAFAM
ncbi:hypothetical protein G6F61_014856 [Rhizopus arrhizus]|nr:hypothetical protein G6F61_014856 [Rhizopus arrhizus]